MNRNGNQNKSDNLVSIGGKVPPHSIDAEKALLGALMLDQKAISKVVTIIEPDSFYDLKNKVIYETILNMFDKNTPVDIVTLSNELKLKDKLKDVGGTFYLTEINSDTPTAANVEYHARIVQEKFLKRSLIRTAGEIIQNAYDDTTDALEEIDNAEAAIFRIAEKRMSQGYEHVKKLAKEAYRVIERLKTQSGQVTGVSSGFFELDKLLGGFQNSDLIIVAGRPSMGKTALALSMARNTAVEYKNPVALFSIEMASVQLLIRLLSAEAKIDQQSIRTGRINEYDNQRIIKALGDLSKAPIIIDDSAMLSLMELRAKCRRLKIEHDIKMVVIDYLQLIKPPKADSREREISLISQGLKQIAKELNIPVVAIAQLNRSVESRPDKRPMLSDLRESGSIEQDADVVMFVNRPEYYGIKEFDDENKTSTEGKAEIIIGKQRNGPVGTVRVAFIKDYARFENLSHISDDEIHIDPKNQEITPRDIGVEEYEEHGDGEPDF